jgi:hypothetical protein
MKPAFPAPSLCRDEPGLWASERTPAEPNLKPSLVTIRATEDLEVMLIFADIATTLVERKPSLAREIGITIESRSSLIEAACRKN